MRLPQYLHVYPCVYMHVCTHVCVPRPGDLLSGPPGERHCGRQSRKDAGVVGAVAPGHHPEGGARWGMGQRSGPHGGTGAQLARGGLGKSLLERTRQIYRGD